MVRDDMLTERFKQHRFGGEAGLLRALQGGFKAARQTVLGGWARLTATATQAAPSGV